ncbi:hypothetical protein [Bradyrhizobium prioriisuperbiae]|uniref:hypothetical protein n=1 Tax=Bradyrhizobium prioriisuperbiae TaxID=2854389 RepID=UPI0028E3129F|nr:hypothetical protein [Bradyrhizobium prioritasuperba]
MSEHGFDITDFGDRWPEFCWRHGLWFDRRDGKMFRWTDGKGLLVVTQNNPESGEYGPGRDLRVDEIGFASYIGIYGPEVSVRAVAESVNDLAIYVKGESVGQSNFIRCSPSQQFT